MTDIAATGAQPGESSPAPDGKLLEVRNLKVHFPIEEGIIFKRKVGAVRAVDGIDLEILQARTLGLVGESGCGKSTTARAIAQLIPSNEGEVLMGGWTSSRPASASFWKRG